MSHPRRLTAWGLPLAVTLTSCLIPMAIGSTAAAASSHRHATTHNSISAANAMTVSRLRGPLGTAARQSARADHALVSNAKGLNRCLHANRTNPGRCSADRSGLQDAGTEFASAQRTIGHAVTAGRNRSHAASAGTNVPVLTSSGQTLSWAPIAGVSSYVVRDHVPGSLEYSYSVVGGTSTTPPPTPGVEVNYRVRASTGTRSEWSNRQQISYPPEGEPPNPKAAPTMTVSGQTISWKQVANVTTYVIVRKVPGQADVYSQVTGTSITPPAVPGATVRFGLRTAVEGSAWAQEVTITYPPAEEVNTKTAPTLSVAGHTVNWNKIGNVNSYVFVRKVPGQEVQYTPVTGTSDTPPVVPGATVSYGLRTNVEGSTWAREVAIAYPATEEENHEPPPPPPSGRFIGTNDGGGWGPTPAKMILGAHITWNRVEANSETVPQSINDGFHTLGIVANPGDNTPLSAVDPNAFAAEVVSQLKAYPGLQVAEAGNEMYLKGHIANSVQYGKMYLAAVNAEKAAGIHTPLLYNMSGDYPRGSWTNPTSWSQDGNGGGWLRDAVNAVPGLGAAILANGVSSHPYGALNEDSADESGVQALAAQERVAQTVLGSVPTFYVTEFGYNMAACGAASGACSEAEQASKTRAAIKAFLGDPHFAGIFIYQSHDDGTGHFGYMNNDNTTRPTFGVLSELAKELGQ